MTTGVSLVRENTLSMQPPRALWVSFPLGRPLGKAGDPEFQHGVIRAALQLLERNAGPVLEDYPLDVPALNQDTVAACPVAFVTPDVDDGTWQVQLGRELQALKPWYELSLRRRGGRTLVGISEQAPEQNVEQLAQLLDDALQPRDIVWLKRAIEDIKAYYTEAMTAQPGDYDAAAIQAQFWQQSRFGAALLLLYRQFQDSDDASLQMVARIIAPREAVGAETGPKSG